MHDSRYRRFAAALGIVGAAVGLSCGESPTSSTSFGAPATLQIVTGRAQIGAAGQQLPEPLTVQVLDSAGHPLPGITVTWAVQGGGTLFARVIPTVTDSAGLVLVFWQLGPGLGAQQVQAQCCGLVAGFSAQAQLPPSQRVGFLSGLGQGGTVGSTLTYPLVVQVRRADGTYDVGASVSWRAISRGNTYSPADTVTNAQGQASTRWTLGTVAGVESTAVFVRGLPPVLITAYGNPGPPVRVTITPRALPSLGVIGDSAWVTASAWDQYDNPISQFPTIRVADTMLAQVWYVTYNAIGVQARHHGTTFVTAQLGAVRDSVPLTVLSFTGASDGGGNMCGLSLAGDAYCWGSNYDGGVGDGTRTARPHPVLIGAGLGLQVLSTDWHTCALDASGRGYCWGYGAEGELGEGSPDYATVSRIPSPVPVAGGHVFSSIGSGRRHTCAVALNGDAYCWGGNWGGQLGRDTLTSTCWSGTGRCSDWPILVAGGLQFANVSASTWEHSCGVTTSGDAYCWGSNASGQLGSDSATSTCDPQIPQPCSFVPLRVQGGIAFKSVSTGDYFTCGVSTAGDGYCWGYGLNGQLGNGAYNNSTSPVPVSGGLSFADIRSGGYSCGLTTGGKLYCWGGGYGAVPVPVRPDLVFASLALGGPSCAVTSDNDLYCW